VDGRQQRFRRPLRGSDGPLPCPRHLTPRRST
jgi:hypothetical protein